MAQTPREKLIRRGAAFGIIVNFFLFALKFVVGTMTGSVSVMADSFNNLSDAGSSVVNIIGIFLAGRPSDEKHPFGHGRMEYIAGFIVAIMILLLGIELLKGAAEKILHPAAMAFSIVSFLLLGISIPVKLGLAAYQRRIGTKTGAPAMLAAGRDSLNDVLVTGTVLLSAVLVKYTGLPLDGYIGMAASLFVIWSGIGILKDTVSPLLGQAPPRELVEKIEEMVLARADVCGTHDLIVHNYGPGKYIASIHAEVRADSDILKIHDEIDLAERRVFEELGILLSIHLDPIDTDDVLTNTLKEKVQAILREIDARLSLHDFRIVSGETHTNLIFDLVVPKKFALSDQALKEEIDSRLKKVQPTCFTVIVFDRSFV